MQNAPVIVGGGLVGLSTAIALAQAGLPCTVLEQQKISHLPSSDLRTTAVNARSQRLLANLGVWPALAAGACPIEDIRIADGAKPNLLHFTAEPGQPMGYIVLNSDLRQALWQRAQALKVVMQDGVQIAGYARDAQVIKIELADGKQITTPLLIGADGRNSRIREWAGIETIGWAYKQQAVIAVVEHAQPHNNIAVEHFWPQGPFALLPMPDGENKQPRSALVWTMKPAEAAALMALDETAFAALLNARIGEYFGIVTRAFARQSYPLSLKLAKRFAGERVVLIGDAAHVIHPIAGQGLNLGWRDAECLAKLVGEHAGLGLDIGLSTVTDRYRAARIADVWAMSAATDGLDRLFSTAHEPFSWLRHTGLKLVEQIPPLKVLFRNYAMGRV